MKVKKHQLIKENNNYDSFDRLNGEHPLKKINNFYISYQARPKKSGKVFYFNIDLAKDMGLISFDEEKITKKLEKKILETFSLVIINEYDLKNSKNISTPFPEKNFMATRYLQLQHPNKKGKTSGDGRSIWNGQLQNKQKCWDVSSRGTGGTFLSPAVAIKNKVFKTGDPNISYGCGLADLSEAIETLFMSEAMNKNGIATERVLAILEFPGNTSIIIRAAPCLLRPSHFFRFLKLAEYEPLKQLFNYYIEYQNKFSPEFKQLKSFDIFDQFLHYEIDVFAKMAARFEDDYIFCWLDWDGDNILMDGGIIDYGSIRQFGLFHHEYRYDDIQRYSTTIKEQKIKVRYIIQTFIQMVDFLKSKKKKNIHSFQHHVLLKEFDEKFLFYKRINFCKKLGLNVFFTDIIIKKHTSLLTELMHNAQYFERASSSLGHIEVSDGITKNAIFSLRDLLREMPMAFLKKSFPLTTKDFIDILKTNYAVQDDLKINAYRKKMINDFQKNYYNLIKIVSKNFSTSLLIEIFSRAQLANKYDRATGDAVVIFSHKILIQKNQLSPAKIQKLLELFIGHQSQGLDDQNILEKKRSKKYLLQDQSILYFYKFMLKILRDHRNGL